MTKKEHKLDEIDKKILFNLQQNARIPLTRLARKLRISRTTLGYRLKQLEKTIIKQYYCILDLYAFGYKLYKVYIKTPDTLSLLTKTAKELGAAWMGKCDGKWDYAITLRLARGEWLDERVERIQQFCICKEKIIVPLGEGFFTNDRWLQPQGEHTATWLHKRKTEEIDQVDKAILNILAVTGRKPTAQIAKEIHLSIEATGKRIRRLNKKLITSYQARINYATLGYDYYHILISLKNIDTREQLTAYLETFPHVIFMMKSTGTYDLQVEIIAKNYTEINKIIDATKKQFGDAIEEIDKLFIVDESDFSIYKG